jgi:hypothetical protein
MRAFLLVESAMRKLPLFASAVMLALASAPVAANDPASGGQGATEAAKPKKICRNLAPRTGSHRPQGRVCKTAEEWKLRDKDRYAEAPFEQHNGYKPEKRNAGLD